MVGSGAAPAGRNIQGALKQEVLIEDEAVNPFAAFAFVELVTPLILGLNKLEIVFGSVPSPASMFSLGGSIHRNVPLSLSLPRALSF